MQFSIPGAAVATLGKRHVLFGETLDDTVCRPGLPKRSEDQLDRTTHLLIGVFDNASRIVKNVTDWQRETQFPFLGFVQFSSLEAGPNEMQFCLGHRSLETQQETVIEVARIVATVFVHD